MWYTQAMVSDEVLHNSTGLLFAGSKPTHVHYTHGRSGGVGHTQLDTMTRQQFWKHLEACCAEAYPERPCCSPCPERPVSTHVLRVLLRNNGWTYVKPTSTKLSRNHLFSSLAINTTRN